MIALAIQRLLPSLQVIYSQWAFIKGSKASQEKILSILDEPINQDINRNFKFSF